MFFLSVLLPPEVMRYERLGTAELGTVYEKEKAPVQSRKPTGQSCAWACFSHATPPRVRSRSTPWLLVLQKFLDLQLFRSPSEVQCISSPPEISFPPTQGNQQRGVAAGIPKVQKAFSSKLNTKLQKEGWRGARTLVRERLRQSVKGDILQEELHNGSLAKRGDIGSLAKRGDILRFPDDFSDILSRHSSSQLGGSESANHRNAPRTDAEGFVHPIAHPRSLPVFPPTSDLQ